MKLKIKKQNPGEYEYLDLFRDISGNFNIWVNGSGILGFVIEKDHIRVEVPDVIELTGSDIKAKSLKNAQITEGKMIVDPKPIIEGITNFAEKQGWEVQRL